MCGLADCGAAAATEHLGRSCDGAESLDGEDDAEMSGGAWACPLCQLELATAIAVADHLEEEHDAPASVGSGADAGESGDEAGESDEGAPGDEGPEEVPVAGCSFWA